MSISLLESFSFERFIETHLTGRQSTNW